MKLGTFEVRTPVGRQRRLGALWNGAVADLNFGCAWLLAQGGEARPQRLADAFLPANMRAFLEAGSTGIDWAGRVLEALQPVRGPNDEQLVYRPDEVRLLAPLPDPASVRDFYAFEDHVKKGFEKRGEPMPPEWYEFPVYYKSGHHHIIGAGEDVPWPPFTEKFDYELELAAVIGREGRDIPASEARHYIAGFTVMNDFSARDIQRREMRVRLGPAKGKDWCTALGPWLEIGRAHV